MFTNEDAVLIAAATLAASLAPSRNFEAAKMVQALAQVLCAMAADVIIDANLAPPGRAAPSD